MMADTTSVKDVIRPGDGTDDDVGEKPVREKLKNTTIDPLSQPSQGTSNDQAAVETDEPTADPAATSARGRPLRKRSFDDIQSEETTSVTSGSPQKQSNNHKRMRSREIANGTNAAPQAGDVGDAPAKVNESAVEPASSIAPKDSIEPTSTPSPEAAGVKDLAGSAMLSPQKKRAHDQVDRDPEPDQGTSDQSDDSYVHVGTEEQAQDPSTNTTGGKGEPEKKRTRDLSLGGEVDEATKPSATKTFGFSNTSSVSPFGTLLKKQDESKEPEKTEPSKTEAKITTSSAFASSGLSAFARAETSPFGALASSTTSSGFGGQSTTKPAGFGFGNASTSSPFATASSGGFAGLSSTSSGFGGSGLGGGFGSGFGSAKPLTGLSSFASPGSPGIIGASTGPTKAFGAPENDDDDDDEEGSGDSDPEASEDKPEKRFVEQELETGEENEDTLFSCKAKLFNYDKEWKERGIGTFKLNVNDAFEFGGEHERKARFIMRTEGVHRVVLNTPVFKGMKVGNNDGKEPTGKMVTLSAVENGKFVPLLLKTGSLDLARDLYRKIMEVQAKLP